MEFAFAPDTPAPTMQKGDGDVCCVGGDTSHAAHFEPGQRAILNLKGGK